MLSGAEMASYVGACVERACMQAVICMQAAICMNGFFPPIYTNVIVCTHDVRLKCEWWRSARRCGSAG